VAVTNGPRVIEFQRGQARNQWLIINPSQARAYADRVDGLLTQLEASRVVQFVADGPKASLESFGLQPPDLEIGLALGTNPAALVQFGKSPTNDPTVVYARRVGQDTVVTIPTNGLALWHESVSAFRDPHLFNLQAEPVEIDVRADEKFSLQRQGTNVWKVLPENVAADPSAVVDLLSGLGESPIIEFHDAVTPLDLPGYGLSPPSRQYVLRAAAPAASATNPVLVELSFGATTNNKVFVRRTDEASSVYAIKLADFQRLPGAALQFHPRRLWQYLPEEVDRVVIRQAGRERQLIHSAVGPLAWSLAEGSPGAIEPLAVNETIKELGRLSVTNWVARGETNRSRFGFKPAPCQITVQLKNGDKPTVEIGAPTPTNSFYGAVIQVGELWIFEFPPWLAQWIDRNLAIPP
jgi:hypothetical protein